MIERMGNYSITSWPSPRDRWLETNGHNLLSVMPDSNDTMTGKVVIPHNSVAGDPPEDDGSWAFFVGANSRTGSRLLARLLSRHPEVQCTHEHFPVPKMVAAMSSTLFYIPRTIGAIAKGALLRPSTISAMLDAWRENETCKRVIGDVGTAYLAMPDINPATRWSRVIRACFPGAAWLLSMRCILDSISSMMAQPWFGYPRTPRNAIGQIRAAYVMNTLSIEAGYLGIDRDTMFDRAGFEASLRSAFVHVGVDPDEYDYDGAFEFSSPWDYSHSIRRWESDEVILEALSEIERTDEALHRSIHRHPCLLIGPDRDAVVERNVAQLSASDRDGWSRREG